MNYRNVLYSGTAAKRSSKEKQQAYARSCLTLYCCKKCCLRQVKEKLQKYLCSECCEATKERNWNLA